MKRVHRSNHDELARIAGVALAERDEARAENRRLKRMIRTAHGQLVEGLVATAEQTLVPVALSPRPRTTNRTTKAQRRKA